jgi:hypothetical protein
MGELGWTTPHHKVDRSQRLARFRARWSVPWRSPPPAYRLRLIRQRRAVQLPRDAERLDWLYGLVTSQLHTLGLPNEA